MAEHRELSGEPLDDRAEAYTKSGDAIAAIAKWHNHIDVDEITHTRWCQFMGLMREVDTWADDTDATADEVLGGLKDFTMFRGRYPDLAPEALGESTHQAMLGRAAHILKVGKWAAQTTSVRRFVALRAIEARETVNVFSDTATPHVAEQPGFDDKFMPTIRALGEAATLWDSIVDGRRDLHTGKQVLIPNAEYYVRLTGAMLRRGKLGARALMHVAPNFHLGVKLAKRAANRLKNGVPEYSTLRIFSRAPKKKR